MQSGRILQMGPPREIYEAPTHRFVADFIGDINLMDGEALAGGGIRLGAGAILPLTHAKPGKVTVAIRPERARLVSAGQGVLDATIVHSAYLGTAMLHKLSLPDGGTFLLRQSEAPNSPEGAGEKVGLALPAEALRVLEQ
jgi:spermidine/putrescine transport system ATP-binding protein